MTTILLAGSRALDTRQVFAPVTSFLSQMPTGTTVLLRKPLNGPPQPFEHMAATAATYLMVDVRWMSPEAGRNRVGTFVRDIQMVEAADLAVLFFAEADDPLGDGGTAHILQKALDANLLTFAYLVGPDGMDWLGGVEPPADDDRLSDVLSVIRSVAHS